MRLLLLSMLLCLPAFGAGCNRNDQSGCPSVDPQTGSGAWVDCGATKGSHTPWIVPNSTIMYADGTTSQVACLYGQNLDSAFPCVAFNANFGNTVCLDLFYPTNVDLTKILWALCYHGGGGFAGAREGCLGNGNSPLPVVEQIQKYARRPNRVGGVGLGIVEVDYRLATAIGTNTFPAEAQDAKCAVWWTLANLPSIITGGSQVAPSKLAVFGPSWGGTVAWEAGNMSNTFYGSSGTCGASAATPSGGFVGVSMWPAMTMAQPQGLSGYDGNGDAPFPQAVQQHLDSNVLATIRTNDTALHFSPCEQIVDANAAFLSPTWMFAWGASDTLVRPSWSGGGQEVCTIAAYAALSAPMSPQYIVYTGAPSTHEGDLTNGINAISMSDAFEFIMGPRNIGWAY